MVVIVLMLENMSTTYICRFMSQYFAGLRHAILWQNISMTQRGDELVPRRFANGFVVAHLGANHEAKQKQYLHSTKYRLEISVR